MLIRVDYSGRPNSKLLCKTNELSSPDYHDRVALANDIGRFFVRLFRCDIDAFDVDHTSRDALPDDLMLVRRCAS